MVWDELQQRYSTCGLLGYIREANRWQALTIVGIGLFCRYDWITATPNLCMYVQVFCRSGFSLLYVCGVGYCFGARISIYRMNYPGNVERKKTHRNIAELES